MSKYWRSILALPLLGLACTGAAWGAWATPFSWNDPEIGPEFMIDSSIVYGSAQGNHIYPAIAFDGTNWLVVWTDRRGNPWNIFAVRVDDNGVVLDSSGIPISMAADDQEYPAVGFDGTNYLVVWKDGRNGGADSSDVYGARVTVDGVLLDTVGIPISTAPNAQSAVSVAFDGANYLVVWVDYRNSGPDSCDLYGARVSPDGTVLDTAGICISSASRDQWSPSVAFDATNYLVAWGDCRADSHDIYCARVDPSGTVLDPAGIAISTAPSLQAGPSVAFGAGRYLIAWHDGRNGFDNADIYCARVDPSGTVLDPAGIPICTAFCHQFRPSVDFDGTNFLVAWDDDQAPGPEDIYGARVNPNGTVLDPGGFFIHNSSGSPCVSFGGPNYLVTWDGVIGARVTPGAAVLDPDGILISMGANSQFYPTLASGNTNYLAVWQDYTDIYGGRVSQAGNTLDTCAITICAEPRSQSRPCAAFDGVNYLVVWEDARNLPNPPQGPYDIYASRVDEGGAVLDPSGIAVCTARLAQTEPSVAFGDTCHLVVWKDGRDYGTSGADVYGSRVSLDGTVFDPGGIPICTVPDNQGAPSVAFDGSNWLVVWQDYVPFFTDHDIYAARVTQAGVILDPAGIPISIAPEPQRDPSVAFNGSNYLVVWTDYCNDPDAPDIYGARLSPDGTLLDPSGIPISTADREQEAPSVTFDGVCWLVVWKDERHGRDLPFIYGARVASDGQLLDPDGFRVSTSICSESFRVDVERGNDRCLTVFSGFVGQPYCSSRILGVFVTETGVEEEPEARSRRQEARLLQNRPNPFSRTTLIPYSVASAVGGQRTAVALTVYDVAGRLVRTLVDAQTEAGSYSVLWNGKDQSGREVRSGVYFYTLRVEDQRLTKKAVVLR